MTKIEKKYLKVFQKRCACLAARIKASDKDLCYDKEELAALKWATSKIFAKEATI